MKNKLEDLNLVSEDVGSLPAEEDFESDRKNVNRGILDKIAAGLDYPTYPQLVGTVANPMNMGLQFLKPLSVNNPALLIKGEEINLVGEDIVEPGHPIGIERAQYFLSFLKTNNLVKQVKGTRACVTGPFTLASYIGTRNLMTCGASKPHVVETLSRTLSRSCKQLSEDGFDIISIDEPFLSVILGGKRLLYSYDQEFVVRMLNTLIKEIAGFSSIHVCGRITPMVKNSLLTTDVDIIDHEFAQSPKNQDAYTRRELDETEKMLAYGCISSTNLRVETVNEIIGTLEKARKLFGERIILKPDCGFGGLNGLPGAYELVFKKLNNMTQAVRQMRIALNRG